MNAQRLLKYVVRPQIPSAKIGISLNQESNAQPNMHNKPANAEYGLDVEPPLTYVYSIANPRPKLPKMSARPYFSPSPSKAAPLSPLPPLPPSSSLPPGALL